MTSTVAVVVQGEDAERWREALRAAMPHARVVDANADSVDYVVTWRPSASTFERMRVRKAIFNLGAGVDALLAVNVRAPHVLVGALAPAMAERGDGVIVNIGSWMSRVGVPAMALYPATKAALEQLTRGWAAEYGPRGVRVTTVSPGPVATDLWLGGGGVAETIANATGGDPDAVAEQAVAATATRRFTRPREVGDLVAQLAGGRFPNLTGVEIVIDGGLTASGITAQSTM